MGGNGGAGISTTHATVTARIDAVLMERHRISFSACETLCRLQESEPQAVRALARQLVSVSPTRASRLVQEQIDAGHFRRGADQGDGRVSLISFTETGREYAETVKRTLEESMKKYFVDPLDDEDGGTVAPIFWGRGWIGPGGRSRLRAMLNPAPWPASPIISIPSGQCAISSVAPTKAMDGSR